MKGFNVTVANSLPDACPSNKRYFNRKPPGKQAAVIARSMSGESHLDLSYLNSVRLILSIPWVKWSGAVHVVLNIGYDPEANGAVLAREGFAGETAARVESWPVQAFSKRRDRAISGGFHFHRTDLLQCAGLIHHY